MSVGKKIKKSMDAPVGDRPIALRDFIIVQNEYRRDICKGDDLSDVPERFRQNLITEGVLAQGKEN